MADLPMKGLKGSFTLHKHHHRTLMLEASFQAVGDVTHNCSFNLYVTVQHDSQIYNEFNL